MSIFSKLNSSVERVKSKLSSEDPDQPAEKQRFHVVSREIKVLTARNIAEQIKEREGVEGKLNPETIREFTLQRSAESGWKDDRTHEDILAMVVKLYHLGASVPDNEL